MISALFAVASILISADTVIPDKVALIDNMFLTIQDVSFEYESVNRAMIPESIRGDGPASFEHEKITGQMFYRNTRALRLETNLSSRPDPRSNQTDIYINKISVINGKTLRYNESHNNASAEMKDSNFVELWFPGSPAYLFMVPYLRELARYEKTTMIYEGKKEENGHSCEVYSFLMGKGHEKGQLTSESFYNRFYFDMARGGHPIRFEEVHAGQTVARISDISLQQIPIGTGKQLWFPISGRFEGILPKTAVTNHYKPGTVVNEISIKIKPESVRLNSGMDDSKMEIRDYRGVVVKSDYQSREIKPQPAPTVKKTSENELKSVLEAKIKSIEEKGQTIEAVSAERGQKFSLFSGKSLALSIAGCIGIMLAGFLSYKQRRSK